MSPLSLTDVSPLSLIDVLPLSLTGVVIVVLQLPSSAPPSSSQSKASNRAKAAPDSELVVVQEQWEAREDHGLLDAVRFRTSLCLSV